MAEKSIEKKEYPNDRRRILVVGNGGYFSNRLINHSVQLAGRILCDIVALSIDTRYQGADFRPGAAQSVNQLIRESKGNGIRCDHLIRSGDFEFEVEEIIHETKRLEFVVMDAETNPERIREITIPIITVSSIPAHNEGGKEMSEIHATAKTRQIVQTAGYGLVVAGLYAAVFINADAVMQYFTRGGLYAALPIVTVFLFSFAHGIFAHNMWSLLGIEAHSKDRARETERKVIEKRKTARKRPRMYAYVNPFHRIDKG